MDWQRLLESFGWPTVALFIGTWGIVKFLKFFHAEWLVPIRDKILGRIVQFFDRLDGSMDRMEERDRKSAHALGKLDESLQWLVEKTQEIGESCKRMEGLAMGKSMQPREGARKPQSRRLPPEPLPEVGS